MNNPHTTEAPPCDRWSIREDGERVVIMHRVADSDGNTADGLPARWRDVAVPLIVTDADRIIRLLEESSARQQVVAAQAQAAASAWQEANTLVSAPSHSGGVTYTNDDTPGVA